MKIDFHASFHKAYKKRISRNLKLVLQVAERIELFRQNPRQPLLKDHTLTGKQSSLRAFSITGDIRIVYFSLSANQVLFLDIGTHPQVY